MPRAAALPQKWEEEAGAAAEAARAQAREAGEAERRAAAHRAEVDRSARALAADRAELQVLRVPSAPEGRLPPDVGPISRCLGIALAVPPPRPRCPKTPGATPFRSAGSGRRGIFMPGRHETLVRFFFDDL